MNGWDVPRQTKLTALNHTATMRSAVHLLLGVVSALALLASASPINTSLNPSTLARRALDYQHPAYTTGGRFEYCGEVAVTPTPDTSCAAPLAADCSLIADDVGARQGAYTFAAADFKHDGWAWVAAKGTCTFAVRFDTAAARTKLLVGTNDVRFYISSSLRLAKNGRLGVRAGVTCFNGEGQKGITWGLIRTPKTV
ncbi:hypothetical protein HYQ45_004070 [Verticillium longisporum]|uniref:Ecp2 effector protein-like domain-containing protein n=1 Tax=Verticillium longisporum TaxID=100787 RepID=A0A8I2ZTS7_VERLO|nr:hypothetical protein HYQ45_004070 [Verticillium longisporum]